MKTIVDSKKEFTNGVFIKPVIKFSIQLEIQ